MLSGVDQRGESLAVPLLLQGTTQLSQHSDTNESRGFRSTPNIMDKELAWL